MGVNLKPLASPEEISLDELKGKVIAIDAYNALHQFLSIIRQRDGTLLKDSSGEVTSHLTGLLYRTSNLVEKGIKPIYVFDGKPHPLKMDTLIFCLENVPFHFFLFHHFFYFPLLLTQFAAGALEFDEVDSIVLELYAVYGRADEAELFPVERIAFHERGKLLGDFSVGGG